LGTSIDRSDRPDLDVARGDPRARAHPPVELVPAARRLTLPSQILVTAKVATMASVNQRTWLPPVALETSAGPGQYPANPQPTPKISAPVTRRPSMVCAGGGEKPSATSGRSIRLAKARIAA